MGSRHFIRIVTWNCNGGKFERRIEEISVLNPDIAIVQEIAKPATMDEHCCWTASKTPYKGVAITARNGFTITPHQQESGIPPVFVPVEIKGPIDFHLLAVWTQKEGKYIESCKAAIDRYRNFLLSKPSIIAGDFNSNTIWDYEHPRMNHSMVVQILEHELGLVSSYHKKLQAVQGKEFHPTFYFHRRRTEPFHIDYCFVPDRWEIGNVNIGTYEEWGTKSDHCPLVVDITIPPDEKYSDNIQFQPKFPRPHFRPLPV